MEINTIELGKKIKKRRTELDLTLSDLSSLSGLAIQLISDYENNRKEPGLKNFMKLCGALKVEPQYFLGDDAFGYHKTSTYGYALRNYITALNLCTDDKLVVRDGKVSIEINTPELIAAFTNIQFAKGYGGIIEKALTNMAINMYSGQEIQVKDEEK